MRWEIFPGNGREDMKDMKSTKNADIKRGDQIYVGFTARPCVPMN